jgi:hypothetical protein
MKLKAISAALACSLGLLLGQCEAKEPKWQDPDVNFSQWSRVILVDLVDTNSERFKGKIGWVSPELGGSVEPDATSDEIEVEVNIPASEEVQPIIETIPEPEAEQEPEIQAENQPEEESAFARAMKESAKSADEADKPEEKLFGFAAAEEQWKEQAQKKLGKKVTLIPMSDCLAYLETKAPEVNWQELWQGEDKKAFWETAAPHLEGYVDGVLFGKMTTIGEGTHYVPPSTQSVRTVQGGSYRKGVYTPRYVTHYHRTPGYYVDTWQASGDFTLAKIDGTPCWTYTKRSNKAQRGFLKRRNQESFFSGFFSRMMSEVPLSGEKSQKPDRDEL